MKREGSVAVTMAGVEAYSIGGQALDRIASAESQASVHSSYRGAINVQTSLGLLSVVPKDNGRGPININVDLAALGTRLPLPGSKVTLSEEELMFEDGRMISLRHAKRYDPDGLFAAKVLSAGLVEKNILASRDVALLTGRMGGLGGLLEAMDAGPFRGGRGLNPFSAAALPAVKSLMKSIGRSDQTGVGEATTKLAGLGIGLTPSADDFLSGLMVSLVLGARNGVGRIDASRVAAKIVDSSAGRTSSLSFEFMRQAASGRVNEKIARLVRAIYSRETSYVRRSTVDAMLIGETSGTDSTVGVLFGAYETLRSQARAGH